MGVLVLGGVSIGLAPPAAATGSGVATTECRLDGGAWASCGSGHLVTGLSNGEHTLEVRSTDNAGNVESTPASRTWTVDTVRPTVGKDGPT